MSCRKGTGVIIFLVCLSILILLSVSGEIYSGQQAKTKDDAKQSIIIIEHTEIFGKLERPQVLFDHNLHAETYEQDGCKTCHPQEEDSFIFDFPFKITTKNKEAVMDAYHEKCIGCHTRLIKENRKTGPLQCGSCHRKDSRSGTIKYPVCEFDFVDHENHLKKLEDDCSHCHHTYNPEQKPEERRLFYEKGTEESCFYCHDIQKKRGPALSQITGITSEKGFSVRKVSHSRCVNCHLEYMQKNEEAGPISCEKCHAGVYRSLDELLEVTRPDRDQPDKPFIAIEEAQMKGVSFNHAEHEKNSRTCRACHHETLKACKECHGIIGSQDGGGINVAGAYHDVFSGHGCSGCHMMKKAEAECSGCHHHLLDMDIHAKGPKKAFCKVCHNGKKEGPVSVNPIAITATALREVPEEVEISILEKEYKPALFPHREVIKKLIEVSNKSDMATYFHRGIEAICKGCHHESDPEAEAEKDTPPHCRRCHSLTFDQQNMNKPRLIAAYHRQCIGCHTQMGITETEECKDCHEEKESYDVPSLFETDGE